MNRRRFAALTLTGLAGLTLSRPAAAVSAEAPRFTFPSIDGGTLDSGDWRGRPVLVVNTASMCGFTPQLADLQALHERLGPKGLVVLAVPSDSFAQEYDEAKRVKEFCTVQYGLTLPMTDILPVTGPAAHPFYRWLARTEGFVPDWNFNKVLLDRRGGVVGTWRSMTKPGAAPILDAITPFLRPA